MHEAPPDAVQLIAGLISHMKQIVGDGACYAMLHYGALEEGKRYGLAHPSGELSDALARIDSILMHKSEILHDDGANVTIKIHSSSLLMTGQRAVQGVVLGLVEGALTSARKARYKGTLATPSDAGDVLIELKREGTT